MENHLSAPTKIWLAETTIGHRKSLGQYMTPRALRSQLIDNVDLFPGIRVLDPSCGTGEFLKSILERQPDAVVTGWDIDPKILEFAGQLVPQATLELRNSLDPYLGEKFDLVIGNPPYFQYKPPVSVKRHFSQVISGRPNIFALFFQVAFECITEIGQIAYVIPPSMNNGAYFSSLREYVISQSSIKYLSVIEDAHKFDDAQTAVQLLVLQVGKNSKRNVFQTENRSANFKRLIFSANAERIAELFNGRMTLFEFGYQAITGSVVWNQHKDKLSDGPGEGLVPLIWAHNITDGKIILNSANKKKPQYVRTSNFLAGPAIIVNRIVGGVGSGELRVGLIEPNMKFVGENHVNVIRAHTKNPLICFESLLKKLRAPEISERIRLITGNTQISATELNHLIPLDN